MALGERIPNERTATAQLHTVAMVRRPRATTGPVIAGALACGGRG
jgi:hypothetical protein